MTAPVCHRPAQRTTEVPANSRHHGPRAVPSVSSVLILPPGPIADRHRCPQERLQAARRSPAYPNTSPDNRACNSLTPFRCPHAVHLYESVDSGLIGEGEEAPLLMRDLNTGSTWQALTDRAISGPLTGSSLQPLHPPTILSGLPGATSIPTPGSTPQLDSQAGCHPAPRWRGLAVVGLPPAAVQLR